MTTKITSHEKQVAAAEAKEKRRQEQLAQAKHAAEQAKQAAPAKAQATNRGERAKLYRYGWNQMRDMVENQCTNIKTALATVSMAMGMNGELTEQQKDWVIEGAKDYYNFPLREPRY